MPIWSWFKIVFGLEKETILTTIKCKSKYTEKLDYGESSCWSRKVQKIIITELHHIEIKKAWNISNSFHFYSIRTCGTQFGWLQEKKKRRKKWKKKEGEEEEIEGLRADKRLGFLTERPWLEETSTPQFDWLWAASCILSRCYLNVKSTLGPVIPSPAG